MKTSALVLACVVLAGCMPPKVKYVEVAPECDPPEQPSLPTIEGESLSCVSDDTYFSLERREKRLVDWALQMRGMLEELCQPPEGGGV